MVKQWKLVSCSRREFSLTLSPSIGEILLAKALIKDNKLIVVLENAVQIIALDGVIHLSGLCSRLPIARIPLTVSPTEKKFCRPNRKFGSAIGPLKSIRGLSTRRKCNFLIFGQVKKNYFLEA